MARPKSATPLKTGRSTADPAPVRKAPSAGANPKTTRRKAPGSTGDGDYYHVEVKARSQFTAFRTQDVGKKGGLQRVSGRKADGTWETQTWRIAKSMAHIDESGALIADHADAKDVLNDLKGRPRRLEGDRFKVRREQKAAVA